MRCSNVQAEYGDIEDDAHPNAVPVSPHAIENGTAEFEVFPLAIENDATEVEIIRMISECLGRYDSVGSGRETEFVDTAVGAEEWDDCSGGSDDRSVDGDMPSCWKNQKPPCTMGVQQIVSWRRCYF